MTNKHQRSVNSFAPGTDSLITVSQYVWIVMTLIAAVTVQIAGGSRGLLAAGIAISMLPAIAGIGALTGMWQSRLSDAIVVFGWTLLAALTMAVTGGARSPAIILFAIAPLTAFAFGRRQLALESAGFAALAYLGVAAISSFGLIAGTNPSQATIGGAAAAMGVVQILLLIWAATKQDRARPKAPNTPALPQVDHASARRADAAEATLKDRTAFFASLSHDLRSPFTSIMGYAEAFKMNLHGNLTDKQVDQASIIHESAQDLLSLVDDMMDFAKSEAGKLSLDKEPLHLGDLGRAIMDQMQAVADRRNVELTISSRGEPWASGDARLVRRIWQNLISNAIKYSEPGGRVELIVTERRDYAVLCVEDHGAGMSQEDLARIAKPFEMGSNANGKTGTGLGLMNVHRFANMHGGKVVIDTAPGEGARFQVLLPKADVSDLEPL